MAQLLGPQLPMWNTRTEFVAPGFGLVLTVVHTSVESEPADGRFASLLIYMCVSQITKTVF